MKTHLTTLAFLISFSFCGLLVADTLHLKDGTKIEGEIVSETDDTYIVSVKITATIKDEKKIAKADVASIDRASPADDAFKAIAELVPTPDLQTVEDYDRMINRQVKAFLEAFPNSANTAKAKAIQKGLEQERAMVEKGAIKLDQKWISPADRLANAYELDARIALDKAERLAAAGKLVDALRALDDIDDNFTAADCYGKAVELSKKVLTTHKAQAAADHKRVDAQLKEREVELTKLPANQRKLASAEIKKRDAAYLALVKADKEAGHKWPRLDRYHKQPLADTVRAADSALRRLENLDVSSIEPAAKVYSAAWAAAVGGDESEAKKLFSQLRSLKVPSSYISALEAQLPEPEPEPAPTPVSDDKPEEEPGEDEEMKDDESSDDVGDDTTEPTSETNPNEDSGDDADVAGADEGGADAPTNASDSADEKGSSMTTMLIAVMGVVILIAVITVFAGGKKKK